MSQTLKRVMPLSDNPDFVAGFAHVLAEADGKVCQLCGLEALGHAPQSRWLGHERHDWTPVLASTEALKRADELGKLAYRKRCELELCGAYCVSTH